MKKFAFLLMALFFVFSCAKKEGQKGPYLAKVNNVTITQEDVSREMNGLPDAVQKMFAGQEGMEKFIDELVKKEILYHEAKKKALDKSPEYLKKVEDFKKLTLVGYLLEKEIEEKAKVSDKDVKDYYEKHKGDFTVNNQIRASHILVKTEEEAKKILDKLKKGGDFAKIAKSASIDPGSAKNGGDLGFFARGQMLPEFENVAFNLKVGEISEPVKTQYGYHIIKVTDRKQGKVIEFEKIKDVLAQRMTAEKQKDVFDSYISGLKKSYKVELNKEAIAKLSKKEEPKENVKEEPKKQKQK